MKKQPKINIVDYDYHLPGNKIATYPLPNRDLAKLLIYKKGEISHTTFKEFPSSIDDDVSLIFNNTKVIQARLEFIRKSGARIELFCLEPVNPSEYSLVFQQKQECTWKCLVGNAKKWKEPRLEKEFTIKDKKVQLTAEKIEPVGNAFVIFFQWTGGYSFSEILDYLGATPIPPYLNRPAEKIDKERYQTIYSEKEGSVAAPTAGLHFTTKIFDEIREKGILTGQITLHVGAGTFLPVKSQDAREHQMHAEQFSVTLNTLKDLWKNPGKTYAVGTTSVRALESLYWMGVKLVKNLHDPFYINQWEYLNLDSNIPVANIYETLINYMEKEKINEITGITRIMIAPGYTFQVVKGMVTNFHQPKSTLLLLIAVFIGKDWRRVYQYALENDFRFLSYGDSSLLIPRKES